jgi:hypothetical protein
MSNSKVIKEYLLKNPINRSESNCYQSAAKHFGVDSEVIRRIWRRLREEGLVEKSGNLLKIDTGGKIATIEIHTTERVISLEDLIRVANIDTEEWSITRWECNKWEVGAKQDDGTIVTKPLFQVKAKLEKRKLDSDLGKQKDFLIKEMKQFAPIYEQKDYGDVKGDCLLEISLFDVHFGKLAHREETGEDYDLKIAEKRFKKALAELLKRTNLALVSRIFFPIGNDLVHVDNLVSTTTAGTPQDTDTRFHKIVKTVRRVLIETIDQLSQIAPVDIVIIPGNHDTTATFFVGEILDAWYNNNPNVTIDNAVKLRKYYKFGKNGFQLTHGDREKQADLGLLFATEEPKLWAETKFRFCQLGHFHKSKKISYVSVDTFQGFQIQIMPSLSGTDAWHAGKGYNSLKQAKAFLYHPEEGLIGEYTYTT